jgi:hypothetical protein
MRRVHWTFAVLLGVVSMGSPVAPAQLPGGHGHTPPGSSGPSDRAADPLASSGAPVLVQLDQLEQELKPSAEQRATWNAYADKILHLADDMTRSQFAARIAPRPTDATALQQLDQLTDRERNRLAAIEDIVAAGRAFYATLTTEQREIADRKLVLPIRPLATGVVLPGIGAAGRGSGSAKP